MKRAQDFISTQPAELINTIEGPYLGGEQNPLENVQPGIDEEITTPPKYVDPVPKFQPYMLDDAEYVGYPSHEFQEQLYASVLFNAINAPNAISILDVGCGRGDLGHYIKTVIEPRFNTKVDYTGIDLSQLIIEIGKEKYQKFLGDEFKLETKLFDANFNPGRQYDWVVHCTNLTLKYTNFENQYLHFMEMVEKSMEVANHGGIFVILNDSVEHETDNYVTFQIGYIFNELLRLGYKFAIDQSDFKEITKIVIIKN